MRAVAVRFGTGIGTVRVDTVGERVFERQEHRLRVRCDGAHHGERGGRVVQVVYAFQFHGRLIRFAVDREGGAVVAHGAQRHVGGQRVGTVLRLRCGRRGSRNGIGSIAGIARIANISAMFRTVVRFRVNSGAHVVIRREEAAQRFVKAEVAYFHAVFRMRHVSKTGDARVLTVEHDGTGGGFRSFGQQSRGVVDLAETVKLVAHHVEQQAVVGRHLLDEMHGVRLVEFQHRDVGVEFAGKRDFRKQRRNHATGEVRAGRVGEHLQSERLQHAGHHACGGGFAVRAGDEHHAERQLRQCARQELRVDAFHDFAGERAATAVRQTGGRAHGLADQRGCEGIPSYITPPPAGTGNPGACP